MKAAPTVLMRVCYILNQFPELSQTFVLRQMIDLAGRGHAVDVIAACKGAEPELHTSLCSSLARLGLADRTTYTGMPGSLWRRALAALACVVPGCLQNPRLTATALDVRRFGWFAATGSLLTMGLPLARERRHYDCLIAHFGPQGVLAQGLREMGVISGPLVTFFHAYDLTSALQLAGRGMYTRLLDRGELQLAISERGAEQLAKLGAAPARVQVHHLGVDVETFHPPAAPRARGGRLRIASVGRLVEKKGFDHGLEAVRQAKSRGLNIDYRIYGSGPQRNALQQRIDALGLREDAKLCGPVSQDQLANVLRESHVMMAPSITTRRGDEEGIPVVLMEALATELPVVATDCGGVTELVVDQECGVVVPQRSPRALADAVCRLAREPDRAARLGRAGRARVLSGFDEAVQGQRFESILESLTRGATVASGAGQ